MSDDAAWRPDATDAASADLALPGYTGFELIARGSESVVYRARQELLGRDVAVKVLQVRDEAATARFRRELELTVDLGRQHPGIVTVLDTGTLATGEPCIVMAHHELGSLHDRLRQLGPLPVSEVVAAGTVVADALAFAHERGVLHRDVKPQNVLLLPTSYVLADFGIARFADAGHTASAERFSYRHASPQVLDGHPPSAADDLWSLGSTLHTLLDGRPPFASLDPDDDTALAYLRRVRTERPRALTRDDVPAELRTIVERCLAPGREDRFADAAAVRDALTRVPTEARSWAPGAAASLQAPGTNQSPGTDQSPQTNQAPETDQAPETNQAPETGHVPPVAAEPADDPGREAPAIAASALAAGAVDAPAAGHADDATLGHPLPPPPPPAAPAEDDEAASRRVDRRVWAFALVALMVSAGLSVAIAFTGRDTPNDPPPDNTVGGPLPELTEPLPEDDLQPGINDGALSPELTLEDRGTSVALRWSDPTDGTAQFVVAQTSPEAGPRRYPAGTTEATLEGLDPDAATYCFRVLAITADGQGVSEEACTTR